MASQQPPMRSWFRLPTMARPAPPPPQQPDPPAQSQPSAPQPRPPFLRPTLSLRPPTPPIPPPQEPVPPPPPPSVQPRAAVSPPISTQPPPPVPPPAANTSSVSRSPVTRAPASTSSSPTSPPPKTSPNSTTLPITSSSSVPPSPKPKTSVPSSPQPSPAPAKPLSNSPAPPPQPSLTPPPRSPLPTVTTTTIAARSAPPSPPPQIIKQLAGTPSPSPKTKSISHPPSPLTLPPAHIKSDAQRETKIPAETEKKTVVVQETIEKPKLMTQNSSGDFQRNVNQTHNSNIAQKNKEITKEKGKHGKSSNSEDFVMRVITIAGDNKGAVMEFSPSNKKKGNPGTGSDEEGRLKMNEKTQKSTMSPPMTAFINSNVQGVNNSILLDSSFTHHDPGIHLSLSRKRNGGGWGTPHKD